MELDGDIAVVGNGAGLVMSTLDMLSDNGGKPACFLDVGGGATTESVYEALTLISKLDRVKRNSCKSLWRYCKNNSCCRSISKSI